jgi:CRISPR-associated protein Cas2
MASRDLYLFCYDISCPSRWRRVHKLLAAYRVTGQKSVFECLMTDAEMRAAVAALRLVIDPTEDRVHILGLDPRMPRQGWGKARLHDGGPLVIA